MYFPCHNVIFDINKNVPVIKFKVKMHRQISTETEVRKFYKPRKIFNKIARIWCGFKQRTCTAINKFLIGRNFQTPTDVECREKVSGFSDNALWFVFP
jgi:hypothetical protein